LIYLSPLLSSYLSFRFFGIDAKILPKIKSSSEIYGKIEDGPLAGIPIAGVNIQINHSPHFIKFIGLFFLGGGRIM